MRISALIAKLERIQRENGDINLLKIASEKGQRSEIVDFNPDVKYIKPDVRIPVIQRPGWFIT